MQTPEAKAGASQAAMINIAMVFKLLEQSLPAFGSTTDQGKAVLAALKALNGTFGAEQRQKANEFIPAELMQMQQAMPGAGGGPPVARAAAAMPPGKPALPTGA